MGELSGIQVMKELEKRYNVWRIVFVSNHVDAVWDTFGMKTLGFERKPVEKSAINRHIKVAIKEYRNNVTIIFSKTEPSTHIKVEDLLYLAAQGNYINVKTKEKEFLVSGNLKHWEMQLNHIPIIRVHKSYVINLMHIMRIDQEVILNHCSNAIPIGRRYKTEVKTTYEEYLIRRVQERVL